MALDQLQQIVTVRARDHVQTVEALLHHIDTGPGARIQSLAADGFASPGGAVLVAVLELRQPAPPGTPPHVILDA